MPLAFAAAFSVLSLPALAPAHHNPLMIPILLAFAAASSFFLPAPAQAHHYTPFFCLRFL
jgi:hypothetical protein